MDGLREGFGTYYYHIGDRYVGYWHENKKHGTGTFYSKDGNLYVGQWRNNEKDGLGTYYYKTGEKYIGEFKMGKKNGRGYFLSSDGNKYVGFFFDNKKNGSGVIYLNNGKKCRELWRNGLLIEFEEITENKQELKTIKTADVDNLKSSKTNVNTEDNENIQDNSFENYIGIKLHLHR